ncbi:uncharacterized protein LOC121404377 [Drosophila obscura]|uniref:uncharacterized protein LOC121404377 n=1 Tax=Drosophila obscura TaxID=7282 RepID=UPI001BB16F2A|nr:uncharacterized protein LOC121404377 [Drosophila obscura]
MSDDIFDRYESDASDLARVLGRLDVGKDMECSDCDADDTMVEASLRNVPDTPADKSPPFDEDHTEVSLEGLDSSLRMCATYMGHDQPDPPPHAPLRVLIADCEAKDIGLIVGCDANALHSQWGSTDTNERGESLFSYILTTQMVILNQGNDPTFIITNREEVLDLTLASHTIQKNIVFWRVLEEHSFSDQRYVETVFSFAIPSPVQFRNLKRTNWISYSDHLGRIFAEFPPGEDISRETMTDLVKTFTDACNAALDKPCPPSKTRGREKP